MKRLRTKVQDNYDNKYSAYLEDGKLGPILAIEDTSVRWSWYVSTLLGIDSLSTDRASDKVCLDFGQDWYVTGMYALMNEVEEVIYGAQSPFVQDDEQSEEFIAGMCRKVGAE